jgi:flavodoxin
MNIEIFYHSKTGNTKKVAEAMAGVTGSKARQIGSDPVPVSADLLFIGAAVYATYDHGIDPVVKGFIERLDPKKTREAVLFCTGFTDNANMAMKELLNRKGIKVNERSFYCKGKLFFFLNFGHPDKTDLENARQFAQNIISKK